MKILAVDDDRIYLRMLKDLFEDAGIDIQCEESGEEALKAIKERPFCLILTDLHMPGMNGIEMTKRAREIAPHTPIMMLTSDISSEIRQSAMEAGASLVLTKGIKLMTLLTIIKSEVEDGNKSRREEKREGKGSGCCG